MAYEDDVMFRIGVMEHPGNASAIGSMVTRIKEAGTQMGSAVGTAGEAAVSSADQIHSAVNRLVGSQNELVKAAKAASRVPAPASAAVSSGTGVFSGAKQPGRFDTGSDALDSVGELIDDFGSRIQKFNDTLASVADDGIESALSEAEKLKLSLADVSKSFLEANFDSAAAEGSIESLVKALQELAGEAGGAIDSAVADAQRRIEEPKERGRAERAGRKASRQNVDAELAELEEQGLLVAQVEAEKVKAVRESNLQMRKARQETNREWLSLIDEAQEEFKKAEEAAANAVKASQTPQSKLAENIGKKAGSQDPFKGLDFDSVTGKISALEGSLQSLDQQSTVSFRSIFSSASEGMEGIGRFTQGLVLLGFANDKTSESVQKFLKTIALVRGIGDTFIGLAKSALYLTNIFQKFGDASASKAQAAAIRLQVAQLRELIATSTVQARREEILIGLSQGHTAALTAETAALRARSVAGNLPVGGGSAGSAAGRVAGGAAQAGLGSRIGGGLLSRAGGLVRGGASLVGGTLAGAGALAAVGTAFGANAVREFVQGVSKNGLGGGTEVGGVSDSIGKGFASALNFMTRATGNAVSAIGEWTGLLDIQKDAWDFLGTSAIEAATRLRVQTEALTDFQRAVKTSSILLGAQSAAIDRQAKADQAQAAIDASFFEDPRDEIDAQVKAAADRFASVSEGIAKLQERINAPLSKDGSDSVALGREEEAKVRAELINAYREERSAIEAQISVNNRLLQLKKSEEKSLLSLSETIQNLSPDKRRATLNSVDKLNRGEAISDYEARQVRPFAQFDPEGLGKKLDQRDLNLLKQFEGSSDFVKGLRGKYNAGPSEDDIKKRGAELGGQLQGNIGKTAQLQQIEIQNQIKLQIEVSGKGMIDAVKETLANELPSELKRIQAELQAQISQELNKANAQNNNSRNAAVS